MPNLNSDINNAIAQSSYSQLSAGFLSFLVDGIECISSDDLQFLEVGAYGLLCRVNAERTQAFWGHKSGQYPLRQYTLGSNWGLGLRNTLSYAVNNTFFKLVSLPVQMRSSDVLLYGLDAVLCEMGGSFTRFCFPALLSDVRNGDCYQHLNKNPSSLSQRILILQSHTHCFLNISKFSTLKHWLSSLETSVFKICLVLVI